MSAPVIEFVGAIKLYGEKKNGPVRFSVEGGEIFGFLGPNGSWEDDLHRDARRFSVANWWKEECQSAPGAPSPVELVVLARPGLGPLVLAQT